QAVSAAGGPVEVGAAGETRARRECGFRSQWKSQKHQRYPRVADEWGTREGSAGRGRVGHWHAGTGRRKPRNGAVIPVLSGHVAAGFVVFADRSVDSSAVLGQRRAYVLASAGLFECRRVASDFRNGC